MVGAARAAFVWGVVLGSAMASPASVRGQASAASERRVVDRAERLRESGHADEALTALADHLARAPASPDALRLFGEIAAETGGAEAFLRHAEAAVAAANSEPAIRRLWVSALIRAGEPDSALAVAGRWVSETPEEPAARVAVADAYLARADTSGAIGALRRGGGGEVLTRLADLLLANGDGAGAVRAWVELLSLDPARVGEVGQDLQASGPERADLLGRLVQATGAASVRARRGAALVALRLGLATEARRAAQTGRATEVLEDAGFLRDYARVAEDAELPGEVAWAAGELIPLSPRPIDRMRWQALAADQSLAAGDSGSARKAFSELARASRPGEGPHDVAARRLFSLLAADPGSLKEAAAVLRDYQKDSPDSIRATARMYGELAMGHARGGNVREAESVLVRARGRLTGDVLGPVDAAGAWLSLFAGRRDSALARASRGVGEPDLEVDEGTRRLRFLTVLQVADSAEVAVLGPALHGLLVDPAGFDPGPTARALAGLSGTTGRPSVLAFFADAARRAGRLDISQPLWRQVAERFPASSEAPQALLDLARATDGSEAAAWLEQLIVGYPDSALAPIARRLLTDPDRGGGSDR